MSSKGPDRQEGGGFGTTADLLSDLRRRAQLWMPDWRPSNPAFDPADIILRAAARTFSEVTSRLDAMPDKLFRDYLHWLGVTAQPGRAARVPLVFKLGAGAEAILLLGAGSGNDGMPILLQAVTSGDPVPLEIETAVHLQSAALATVVGAKPGANFYAVAPDGLLTATGPADGVDRWELVSGVKASGVLLQLRPVDGLVPDMQVIDTAGARYRVTSAKDGLVTIDPPTNVAMNPGRRFRRATEFDPFAEAEPDRQAHALYLGSKTALDVAAAASLEIVGKTPPSDVDWHYWGKDAGKDAANDTPGWRSLIPETSAGRYILRKEAGAIEPYDIGGVSARWLRATRPVDPGSAMPVATVAQLALRINPGTSGQDNTVKYEAIAPTAPLVTDRSFHPFGREPRRFDSFNIGSSEAFSKPDACVHLDFELGDGFATPMSVAWGYKQASVAAAIGNDGRLISVALGPSGTQPEFLASSQPAVNGRAVALSTKSRPGTAMLGAQAVHAASDGTTVWFRRVVDMTSGAVVWDDLGAPAQGELGDVVLLAEEFGSQQAVRVYTVQDGTVYSRLAPGNDAWTEYHAPDDEVGPILRLSAVDNAPNWHGQQPLTTMLAAIGQSGRLGLISGRSWTAIKTAPECDPEVYPQVVWHPDDNALVAAFAKVAPEAKAGLETDRPKPKVFGVGPSAELRELEVDLVGQALAPVRLNANGSAEERFNGAHGVILAARNADGTTVVHLWSPFEGGFDQIVDPVPTSSRYVQTPVPMTLQGDWICPRYSGSVGVMQVAPDKVSARKTVRCLLLSKADQGEDWTELQLRVPDVAASLMRISAVLAAPDGGALIVPDTSWTLPPGEVLAESFRGETLSQTAIGTHHGVEIPRTAKLEAFLADPLSNPDEMFLSFTVNGKARLIRATPDLSATDKVVFVPIAGTPAFRLSPQTQVTVCVRLKVGLAGRIVSAVDVVDPPGPRLAVFDLHTLKPLAFQKFDTRQKTLILLDTPDDVQVVLLSQAMGLQSLSSPTRPRNPELSWEYWNGSAWSTIIDLLDGTGNLVNSGRVQFCVPIDLAPTEVLGRPNSWIRARLVDGDYGSEKVWVETDTAGKQTVKRDASGISAPVVARLTVTYSLNRAILFAHVLTEDAGTVRDQTATNAAANAVIPIFVGLSDDLERSIIPEQQMSPGEGGAECGCGCETGAEHHVTPGSDDGNAEGSEHALFLGFDAPLSGAPVNLFFKIPRRTAQNNQIIDVSALTLSGFQPIPVEDGTFGLSETGMLSLDLGVPMVPTILFGRQLHWLKIAPRGSMPGTSWAPKMEGIYLNAAWATAAETQSTELLGSSDASPELRFSLARPPVVQDSLELRVRELLGPDEAVGLGSGDGLVPTVLDMIGNRPGPWVLWQEGDLTTAGPESRVFALDAVNGEIRFGDGVQGRIPPAGRDVIMAVRYRTGGTAAANAVRAWGTISLVSAVQGVEEVRAPEPAAGGSDPQTVAEVLQTAPAALAMHDRAVTLQDFGRLALRASDEIGQAVAIPRPRGVLAVVIAMRGADPLPSNAVLRETAVFLRERAMPAMARQGALVVVPPTLEPVWIEVDAEVDAFENLGAVNARIAARILRLLDPTMGGADGSGWPFGMMPEPDDIAAVTGDVPHLVALTRVFIRLDRPPGHRMRLDAMVVARTDRVQVRSKTAAEKVRQEALP